MRYLRLRSILPLLCLLPFLFAACGGSAATPDSTSTSGPVTLNVFAAASLTESFNTIKTMYHAAHPNVTINYSFAGSQALVQQIQNGANADVFASADQINMDKAVKEGLVAQDKIFVRNKLTVIVPASNPKNVKTLKDLAQKGLKFVVAAPTVPVGKYGLLVLDKLGKDPNYGAAYESSVKANIVSQEDNVKAVVNKVQLGEADAGIVYVTDVTASVSDKIKNIEIPDNFNVIAQYPIAVTKNSTHAKEADDFEQYILSPDGQAVLAKYHFIVAG
ncbi:MAG: molybdate ABC transporter substrate-binding protein [Ktedonobacteraceae bacterium]